MSIDFQGILKALGQPGAIIAVWTPDQLEKDFLEGKPYPGPAKRPVLKEVGEGAVAVKPKRAKDEDPSNLACGYCGEAGFRSCRSRGQHERNCVKNPQRKLNRIQDGHRWTDEDDEYIVSTKDPKEAQMQKLGVSKRALECRMSLIRKRGKGRMPKYGRGHPAFTKEEREYIISHPDVSDSEIARALGKKYRSVTDFRYRRKKAISLGVDAALTATTAVLGEVFVNKDPLVEYNSLPVEKKPSFWETVKGKFTGPQTPADFNKQQKFGVGAYVYHAPARKIGKIVTVDQSGDKVTVDFSDRTQVFPYRGAQFMFNEMMARGK